MNKKYTLQVIDNGDNGDKVTVMSLNDGFTAYEVLGLLDMKREDVIDQIKGNIKPDIIKREFVKDDS